MTYVDRSAWTPAPRPGLIPLHPLGFGTIMGRSFAVLRGNTKTLLGFAVGMQMIGALVSSIALAAFVAFLVSRLVTVDETSPDFDMILAGSIGLYILAVLVISVVVGATSILAQAATVAEVGHASLGEKAPLRVLWQRIKRAFWPMVGYSLLYGLAMTVALVVIMAPGLLIGALSPSTGGAVGAGVYTVVAYIGIYVLLAWVSTKLFLVPSAIVLEKAGPLRAVKRSWTLTRGRFWSTFGVWILLTLISSAVIGVAFMAIYLIAAVVLAIFIPLSVTSGDPTGGIVAGTIVGVVVLAVVFLLQSLFIVVLSAGGALTYLDARMRDEGIDVRMQRCVEARQRGVEPGEDPYSFVAGAAPSPYVAPQPYAPQPAYSAAPGYPAPPAHPQQYPHPSQQAPAYPQQAPAYPPYPPQPSPGHPVVPPVPQPGAWPQQAPASPPQQPPRSWAPADPQQPSAEPAPPSGDDPSRPQTPPHRDQPPAPPA